MPDETEKNLEEEQAVACQQGTTRALLALSNTIGEDRVVPKTSCAKFEGVMQL